MIRRILLALFTLFLWPYLLNIWALYAIIDFDHAPPVPTPWRSFFHS